MIIARLNTGSVVTCNTATNNITIAKIIINTTPTYSTIIFIIITTAINSTATTTINTNVITILTAINITSMGIVTTTITIATIIVDNGSAVIRNTAVISLTTGNIVSFTVDIINNNNINGLTVFNPGSIAIIIIYQTITNIGTTNITGLKNPSTFAFSPAMNG